MPSRIEKGLETIAAGIMGAVKATKGKLSGLTGVFEHLAREHGEVTALLLRLKASSDPELRSFLFPKIRAELLSHEKSELAEVFPLFARFAELAPFAKRHDADADKLEALLDELTSLPYTDARWTRRFNDLVAAVDRHATEEENKFFPVASKVLGRETTKKILDRYEATKKTIMKSLGTGAKGKANGDQRGETAAKRKSLTKPAERTAPRVATRKSAKKASTPGRAKAKRSSATGPSKKTPASQKKSSGR
jgi:hypothetical protein